MGTFHIAEVARWSGIPASTLRFYEEKGLIASVGRHGLRRLFETSVLDRLALIALGRQVGFSLDEIGQMVALDGGVHIDRQLLSSRLEELDRVICKLSVARDELRLAAASAAPSHVECPAFRRYLNSAISAEKGERRKKAGKTTGIGGYARRGNPNDCSP